MSAMPHYCGGLCGGRCPKCPMPSLWHPAASWREKWQCSRSPSRCQEYGLRTELPSASPPPAPPFPDGESARRGPHSRSVPENGRCPAHTVSARNYASGQEWCLNPASLLGIKSYLCPGNNRPQSAPAFRNRQCGTDWQLLAQSNSPAKHGGYEKRKQS